MIRFEPSIPEPFVPYALRLAASFLGVEFEIVDPSDREPHVDIYYGNDARRPCGIRIPHVSRYTLDSVPGVPRAPESGCGAALNSEAPFPFDIFAAMRFWLADEGNALEAARKFDEHERLIWKSSAQELLGLRETPVVNAYLIALREWLELRLAARTSNILPRPARCLVMLSHDVDRPIDPGKPGHILRSAGHRVLRGQNRLPALKYGAIAVAEAMVAHLQRPRPRHWIFSELADAESAHGFRSTFFFAPTSRFDPDGTRFDVAYDISADRFRILSRMLLRRQFEVALHIGYRAGSNAERIRREKARLEGVIGAEVVGARHHYWHTGYPFWETLEAHGAAGLHYDSSIAFNDAAGFRLGIAFPYHPWNPVREGAVTTLQIPSMVMDGAYFYRRGRTVDGALREFQRLIDNLKRCEGIASIGWHQETSLPTSREFREWGRTYLAILDMLSSDPEIAVRTFSEVAAMSDARSNFRVNRQELPSA
jgi:hypothetical protein